MATSSSVDTQHVIYCRQQKFAKWQQKQSAYREDISKFHLQQDEEDTSSSVFMARDTTHTKSITQIKLSESNAQIAYFNNHIVQSYRQSVLQDNEMSVSPDVKNIQLSTLQLKTA